jgi:hypothetical protein
MIYKLPTSECALVHINTYLTPPVLSPLIVNLAVHEHPQKHPQKVTLGHLPEQGKHVEAVNTEHDSHLYKVSLLAS